MEDWIAKGTLLKADSNAQYAAVIEIDLAEVAGAKIDEVFIGSCMTNIGHFRAAGKVREGKSDIPTRLWIAPLTKMDALAGRIITVEEYMEQIKLVNAKSAEVYRYMNFDQIPAFVDQVATVET